MANKLDYLTALQAAIKQTHHCDVTHCETVPVHERVDVKTMWKGDVEVFDVSGHPEAKKCYAWSYHEEGRGPRVVAIFEKQSVNSPEMAVKCAIFFNVQPAPYPRPNQNPDV